MKYKNAQKAFENLYKFISLNGHNYSNTKAIFNINFEILNPLENQINTKWRKWNKEYADFEWQWYLSGNKSGVEISKKAKIWKNCMDSNGDVNSNYGWHWQQKNQLDYVVEELINNPETRRASISIYNAKERHNFENDTPCTYAINFYILNNKLNMSVMMRSNDLWYGFCNDQYFFSKLQKIVSKKINKKIGTYFHFVNNMHIYNNFLNKEQ